MRFESLKCVKCLCSRGYARTPQGSLQRSQTLKLDFEGKGWKRKGGGKEMGVKGEGRAGKGGPEKCPKTNFWLRLSQYFINASRGFASIV